MQTIQCHIHCKSVQYIGHFGSVCHQEHSCISYWFWCCCFARYLMSLTLSVGFRWQAKVRCGRNWVWHMYGTSSNHRIAIFHVVQSLLVSRLYRSHRHLPYILSPYILHILILGWGCARAYSLRMLFTYAMKLPFLFRISAWKLANAYNVMHDFEWMFSHQTSTQWLKKIIRGLSVRSW